MIRWLCGLMLCLLMVGCATHTPVRTPPYDVPTFTWSTVVLTNDWYTVPGLRCNLRVDTIDKLFPCEYDGTNIYVTLPFFADGWMAYVMVGAPGYVPHVERVQLHQHITGPSIYLWRTFDAG